MWITKSCTFTNLSSVPNRVSFGHHAMLPNATQLYRIYQIWKAAVDSIADVDGLIPTLVVNVAPASAAHVGLTNGIGNAWGLTDSQSYIWWQASTAWNLQQDMGDAGEWQDPFAGYAQGNVEKMKSVRAAYDTGGVFSRLNWGGFKLGP